QFVYLGQRQHAGQTRQGPLAPELEVKSRGEPLHDAALAAERDRGIAQERDEVDRRELAAGDGEHLPREAPGARLVERCSSRIVDVDAVAVQLGGNTARQDLVARDDAD